MEILEEFGLKLGTYRNLNEYMAICEYKRSRSFFDLCPRSPIFRDLIMSSKATGPVVTKFHMEPPGFEGTKVCQKGTGHMTNMAATPINGKTFIKPTSTTALDTWHRNL